MKELCELFKVAVEKIFHDNCKDTIPDVGKLYIETLLVAPLFSADKDGPDKMKGKANGVEQKCKSSSTKWSSMNSVLRFAGEQLKRRQTRTM